MDFIHKLPEGLDSYLEHPVPDVFSGLPEGTTRMFGRPLTYAHMRGYMEHSRDTELSGGQRQKIALYA